MIPVFEKFLVLLKKSSPVVHFLYDEMCEIILKLLRRFIRPQALVNKYGSDLASIECQNVKIQLSEPEIVIGEMTRNAMAKLTSDQQKQALLGMRSFFKVTSSQLQVKLPLDNLLLRQLGCLNPLKREKKSTVTSIQSITMKLQPKVDLLKLLMNGNCFKLTMSFLHMTREKELKCTGTKFLNYKQQMN